jgi:pantoate--beta-alanine ligase
MKVITTVAEMHQWRALYGSAEIGFVPTMGALHKGHISLVQRADKENAAVVVSIFINPTQFNDPRDLQQYPRTLDADVALLNATTRCDVAFVPSVEEVYPEPDTHVFDFGALDKVMEGEFRPGHFNGVAQVVRRLFGIVLPTRAYFGEKDFQQLAIIKELQRNLELPIEIVSCPTVREADGLAVSSRNVQLTPEQRAAAPLIARTLFDAVEKVCTSTLDELKQFVVNQINSHFLLNVEYFEIVDTVTLQPVRSLDDDCSKQACIAVKVGQVRLIDNVRLG